MNDFDKVIDLIPNFSLTIAIGFPLFYACKYLYKVYLLYMVDVEININTMYISLLEKTERSRKEYEHEIAYRREKLVELLDKKSKILGRVN